MMTTTAAKLRAIIYGRNSTKKQEEAGTIETQIDFITHDAVTGVKFEILPRESWYLDTGTSGSKKPLWERRHGKRLLEDIKAKDRPFDVVLCYKFNRMGRKMIDTEQAINEILAAGVVIYDVKNQMTIDNSSATGILIRQMMGIMAEFEAKNDAEAMMDGQERLAREGRLMPTYIRLGYQWTELDERGKKAAGAKMVIDPEEAKLVKLIFDLYETWPQSRIRKWLNDNGYRKPRKAAGWRREYGEADRFFYDKDIMKVIRDPLYTGTVTWGKTTTVPGKTPTPYSYHVPEFQIISFEQFNRCQRIMQTRRGVPNKSAGSPFIYSGLIRCRRCGGRTVGKRQYHSEYDYQETHRYECAGYTRHGKSACTGSSNFEQTVTKAVVPFLADLFEEKLGLRRYVEDEARSMVLEEGETKIQRLQGQIEAAKAQLKNIQTLAVQGSMTAEEARPFILDARETIERCTAQLETLERTIEIQADLAEAITRICSDIRGTLERLEPMALQMVVRQVFKSFSIEAGGVGAGRWAQIKSYEFTEGLKELLASSTLGQNVPALEIV